MDATISNKTRSLVVATGILTAISGSLRFGGLFLIIPSFMVVGALLQPRFRNLGRGLMLAGALLLSAWVLPYGILILFQGIHELGVTVFTISSTLLTVVCDFALVAEEVRIRGRAIPSS